MSSTATANSSAGVRWDLTPLFETSDAARSRARHRARRQPKLSRRLPRARCRPRRGRARGSARAPQFTRQPALADRLLRGAAAVHQHLRRGRARHQRRCRSGPRRGAEPAPLLRARVDRGRRRARRSADRGRPRSSATATTWQHPPLRAAHAQRVRGGHARRARAGRCRRWSTLFDQVTSSLQIPFEGADRTIDEVLVVRARRAPGDAHRRLRGALRRARSRTCRPRRTCTTRSSPTASRWTACAATAHFRAAARPRRTSFPRRPSTPCSTPSSGTTRSPTAGGATRRSCSGVRQARARPTSTRRSARAALHLRRGDRAGGELARPGSRPAHRAGGARPVRGRPHRRRAAPGQARRRVLRLGRTGRAAVHPAELHREAR